MNGIFVKTSPKLATGTCSGLLSELLIIVLIFSLQCSYGCKPTPHGARCYCPEGKKADGTKCIDADECEWDESCAQICTNTLGSYKCSCVSGYNSIGRDCKAINCKCNLLIMM